MSNSAHTFCFTVFLDTSLSKKKKYSTAWEKISTPYKPRNWNNWPGYDGRGKNNKKLNSLSELHFI